MREPRAALDILREKPRSFAYRITAFCTYWRIVFSEYWMNHCLTRSSALAYNLLLTAIPLVASASVILANVIEVHPQQFQRLLGLFLPYAPETLNEYIVAFFVNAQKLRGWSAFITFFLAVGLFGAVEEALNTIWKVSRSRSFFVRLRTFTMAMFYSPILFYFSFFLRKVIRIDEGMAFYLLSLLPPLFSMLAFAVLIWFVPNTKVKFSSACLGGIIAGALFELERLGFKTYVLMSIQTQTIYGAFAVVILFLVSLWVVSLIALLGAEIAFVYQNFRPLLRSRRRWERRVGDYKTYIGFRCMLDIIISFARRQPPVAQERIMARYELTEAQAAGIIGSLTDAGFIHNVSGKNAYVPAFDFMQKPVKIVLDAIEDENRHVPTVPDDYTRDYLDKILQNLKNCVNPDLEGMTFERLIVQMEDGDKRRAKFDRL